MKTSIGFTLYRNGKPFQTLEFDRPIVNIGKLSTATLRLDDIHVSRRHAVIERRHDGGWRLTDLGSANGTRIAGERVVQRDLRDGDRLVFGNTTVCVHLPDAAATRPPILPKVISGTVTTTRQQAPGSSHRVHPVLGPRKPTEIRGLGADSFLSKRVGPSSGDGIPNTLEVALLWGETVLAVERFDRPQTVQVGEAQGCRFTLPREALSAGSYPLIQAVDDAFVLNWANPHLTGDLLVDGKVQGLDDLRAEGVAAFTFAEPARARLKAGAFTLLVTFGPAPKKVVAPALGDVDVDPWISVAVSAIVHVAFLVSLSFMPLDLGQLTERDPRQALDRTVEALMIQPDAALAEAKAPEVDRAPSPLARRDANTADLNVANPEVEGDAVRPTLSDALARPRPDAPTHDSVSASHQRSRAKQLVQETALNQAMAQNNPLLTEVLNTVPDTTHRPTFKALAGSDANRGPSLASSLDVFGGSTFAPNGGPLQTVGGPTSPAGQPGSGPVIAGLPRGPRNGGDGPGFVAPEERKPAVIGGKLATTGGLDRRTVELHIRRNIGGIKWCYQERLQLKRGLTGKVTVAFTILPNGRVANARTTNSSLSDAVLEGCIRTKVSRWKFPAVKDGGVAEVEYPLVLRTP